MKGKFLSLLMGNLVLSTICFAQPYYGDTIWVRDYSSTSANSCAFSPDQTKLAVAYDCMGPMVRVMDVADGHVIWESATPDLCLFNIKFSSTGQYIAIAEEQGHLMVIDITIPDTIYNIDTQTGGLNAVNFSLTGDTVYAGGNDGSIRLYQTTTGALIHTIPAHSDFVLSLDISASGKFLASGSADNTVKVWDLQNSYQLVHTFTDNTDDVKTVRFTPDENRLLAGGADTKVYIYLLSNGSTDTILAIHSAEVNCIDVSADGSFFASGSTDMSIKMINLYNYDSTSIFTNQLQTQVNGVAISPGMDKMGAGNNTGAVVLYNLTSLIGVENPSIQELNIYPNPATDYLTVHGLKSPSTYQLIDVNGKICQTGITSQYIDVSTLPMGLYVLQVGLYRSKIIKR